MFLRKQTTYSENRVYPYLKLSDFNQELISRIRKRAVIERADHPWKDMSDEELMRSAGLYKHDHQSEKDGYTLAAVLLLGKDETIRDVLPHHKTDAILRVVNIDRYDDRDDIRTNLIDSYYRLMAFIRKHLPDPFYLEGDKRISIRERIFREVVVNMLIHREYINAFPAKLIIEKNRALSENWNRPQGTGRIDPANFSPYPKNPVIASFFKEIGEADELGSGVRSIFKYCGPYSQGGTPELIEDDVFRTIIPLRVGEQKDVGVNVGAIDGNEGVIEEAIEGVNKEGIKKLAILLKAILNNEGNRTPYYAEAIKLGTERTIERYIKQLKDANLIEFRGEATQKGGYYLTPALKQKLNIQ